MSYTIDAIQTGEIVSGRVIDKATVLGAEEEAISQVEISASAVYKRCASLRGEARLCDVARIEDQRSGSG